MRIRRSVLVAILAVSLAPFARGLAPSASAQQPVVIPYAVASETTYRIDTANGRISVTIRGEYQNRQGKELATLPVFIMPGAENLIVKSGDAVLATKITAANEAAAVAGSAVATLPVPLKQNLRIVLDATYDIAPRTGGNLMTLEPGLVETPFIGQGKGSFVLIDVPEVGDNYLDPGCLVAADQPKALKADGYQRWVCGEVTLIAINSDDPDIVRSCAAMDDKCRQRSEIAVFSVYAQSITDASKAGRLEGEVAMADGRNVKMVLKYFKRDQAWADRQWELATKSFPRLEAIFGFTYPLDSVSMRQSHHIGNTGSAGMAFNKGGEVLLQEGSGNDDETTIHELAHQWALYRHYDSAFMVEGLAVYATDLLLPEFGIPPSAWGWQSFPVSHPLLTWQNNDIGLLGPYFYGRSGAFWHAYEAAVGGRENMSAILARIDDEQSLWPLEAGWFMDQGEWVGGKDLDALFLEWVFNPVSSKSLLEQRRSTHTGVRELQARALIYGLNGMPSDIYDNLLAWVFDPVPGQVAKAHKVLDAYAEVVTHSTEAGLGTPDGVARVWGKKRISDSLVAVEEQRQAIIAILASTKDLEAAADDSTAKMKLAEAREKYAAGDFTGARQAASGGVTAAYNEVAASKMLAIAREKQESFSPNFFGRIGMFWTDPDAKLIAAEQALAEGDGTRALGLARSAYDSWDGASQRGIQRLALGAGIMCALTFAIWYLLKRLDGPTAPTKKAGQGHYLEDAGERLASWKDWENGQ